MVNRGAEDGWLVAVVHGRKDAKSAPEAPPRLVRLAPYRSRVSSVLWSRCLRPGVMGDPFDSKEACVRACVCVGVPTSNQELGKGCLSERAGDHKGDGIVSCFGLSQEPPSCDSPRPALDKSCPDYLRPYLHSILLSSFCKPPKPPNSPITWLSVSHHPSPSYRRASTHTEKRGTLPKLQLVCVCVPGNHQQRTPNCPDSLHRAAAAAPDNVSSRPFCCLQQRAPPPWFCPFFHVPAAGAHICSTSPANIDVVNPQPKR